MTSTWGVVVEVLTPAAFSMFGLGVRPKKRSSGCAVAVESLGSLSGAGAARARPGRVANTATLRQRIQIRPEIDGNDIRMLRPLQARVFNAGASKPLRNLSMNIRAGQVKQKSAENTQETSKM
jgi:hypothetical protein